MTLRYLLKNEYVHDMYDMNLPDVSHILNGTPTPSTITSFLKTSIPTVYIDVIKKSMSVEEIYYTKQVRSKSSNINLDKTDVFPTPSSPMRATFCGFIDLCIIYCPKSCSKILQYSFDFFGAY